MVARGNKGQIVGCIAVEVSVCMGEVSRRAGLLSGERMGLVCSLVGRV